MTHEHQINIHIYIWITLVNPHGSTAAAAIDADSTVGLWAGRANPPGPN